MADKKPGEIYAKLDDVTAAFEKGSLITVVCGIKALAKVAAAEKRYKQKIFPILIVQLKNVSLAMCLCTLKASCSRLTQKTRMNF